MSSERGPSGRPGAQAPGRWSLVGRRIALLLLGLSLSLFVCEWAARRWLSPPFVAGQSLDSTWKACARLDPELGWSLEPNAKVRVRDGELDYLVEVNSKGRRDLDRAQQKPAGVQRVLLLGDSTTFGWGVQREQRFGEELQRLLGTGVEVLNLSSPGWGTDQELLALVGRGFDLQPDLVVLGFVLNDLIDMDTLHSVGLEKPEVISAADGSYSVRGQPIQGPFLKLLGRQAERALRPHSAAFTWLVDRRAFSPARAQRTLEAHDPTTLLRLQRHFARLADPQSQASGHLRSLARVCREHEVDLLALVMPHQHDSYLLEPSLVIPPQASGPDFRCELSLRLAECGAREGFATTSVDQALLDAVRLGRPLHCGDAHFNAAGNQVVAEALAPVIRERLAALGPK